jgi:outer membrane lipopolysaccharide assembly protein LptE/RlpB
MRSFVLLAASALLALTGCGYHALGSATHLPPGIRILAVPVFTTHMDTYHTETVMTDAVIREFSSRSSFRVTPDATQNPDAILHGTILAEVASPLTYNASTQETSSFLITIAVAVKLTDREGKVLYQNDHYIYREQYQSTADLPTFLREDPAAVQRLSRNFARQLVDDIMAGF